MILLKGLFPVRVFVKPIFDYFSLVFRWLTIPWLQAELDRYAGQFNNSPRRADKRKLLPSGIPNIIATKPHLFGAKDFRVSYTI